MEQSQANSGNNISHATGPTEQPTFPSHAKISSNPPAANFSANSLTASLISFFFSSSVNGGLLVIAVLATKAIRDHH